MSTDYSENMNDIEGNGIKDSTYSTNSTIVHYLTTADFSVLILGLTTYFAFPAANNFFGFGLSQNQVLYASSILLMTCFAAAIAGSILHFMRTYDECKKISESTTVEKQPYRFWVTISGSTLIFQFGLLMVATVAFEQAMGCMATTGTISHAASIYHFSSLLTSISLVIGTIAFVACLPDILSCIKVPQRLRQFLPAHPSKKKLQFLLPIAFLTYAFAGFSFIALHQDAILCLMIGFLAMSLGMVFCDATHLFNVSRIKSDSDAIKDNQSNNQATCLDSVFYLTVISAILLTTAIVLYVQNPVFFDSVNMPHFTVAFDLFLIGAAMLAVGLVCQSIAKNRNLDRYAMFNDNNKNEQPSAPSLNNSYCNLKKSEV